ncbi:beta-glucosidase BglX [Prolixibacter sp. SD074]|uniref:beta-glucosidase BglX n=1 Tax=Prolixibacter sp. SD074 TaxID=2652391 RepID=UPI00127EA62D|nr:beta-glucosidase BglX [Prolixibacter sp. SD074]GET29868.1 beta-glucosidase [Prolixibacter sp. SD074]
MKPNKPGKRRKTGVRAITAFAVVILAMSGCQPSGKKKSTAAHPGSRYFTDPVIAHKVDSVLSLMTLEEKAGQLCIMGAGHPHLEQLVKEGKLGGTNGVLPDRNVARYTRQMQKLAMQSHLKIPLLFMGDVIHGFQTAFPVPLALAASWDPGLVRKADSISAVEATASGVSWTFNPMIDIARDPRWGRIVEGAGEDPYLGSLMAAAAVRGYQGESLASPHTMMATAKHFVGYGAVQAGRDYNTVNMPERELREVYLPPFKAAVKAGIGAVMPAFVAFNGVPVTANRFLLHDILRKELGFNGIVVSDYDAVPELEEHGVAASSAQADVLAMKAGVDIDLHSGSYLQNLPKLVKEGKIPESVVDDAVRKVLTMKFELGLFDNPFRYSDSTLVVNYILPAGHREAARKAARETFVLLKNEKNILPLGKKLHSIAVIGPAADNQLNLLGPVHALARTEDVVTVLQGIKNAVSPWTKVSYAEGTGYDMDSESGFPEAVRAARNADVAVMVLGENNGMCGEGDSRASLQLPGNQLDLVKAVVKTGKPVVAVLVNGRPLAVNWLNNHVPGILETWFPGTEGGNAIADVLFGDYNPSGKLPVTFPRSVGQVTIFYSHLNTGRTFDPDNKYTTRYVDMPNTPLYPFGYGLSYTAFSISPVKLSMQNMSWNDTLNVSVSVVNTGKRAGTEVLQLYTHQQVASVSPPVKKLRAFRRVRLAPGEVKEITFPLTRKDLAILNQDIQWKAEPGTFDVMVGSSSGMTISAGFTLNKP